MFETIQKYMTDGERVRFNEVQTESAVTGVSKTQRRGFKAARVDRTTSDWIYSPVSTNQILRSDLRKLRERSRDLARNNPYAKKYFRLVRNNVIGKGVTLQVRPSGKQIASDAKLSKQIEDAFFEWGKKENCSASGKLSWRAAQQLFITHLARDGEAVVRKIYGKNKFGFSLKFYSAAWLDETYNDTLPSGNRVIMSVEVDNDDRPVAYYLTQPPSEYQRRHTTRYRTRVPAEEIIHSFVVDEDEEQTRGVPWLHASMIRFRHFDGYEEAEIVGKRAEACQMAFLEPPEDETAQTTAESEDDEGRRIQPIQELEPGAIAELPPGYKMHPFNPKQDAGASDFKTMTLQAISAGGDVSHHSLTGDLSRVNYSSAKIGGLEERDNYTSDQEFVIENFCEPVYRAWLESAFLNNAVQISVKEYERVKDPSFRARGWTWVEPFKEAQAARISLEDKTTTLTEVLSDKGIDIEDHFATIQKERETAKKFDVDLDVIYQKNPVKPQENADGQNKD